MAINLMRFFSNKYLLKNRKAMAIHDDMRASSGTADSSFLKWAREWAALEHNWGSKFYVPLGIYIYIIFENFILNLCM